MVVATLVISCVGGQASAGDVEVDFDSESAGGDGVAGQVIGSVTPGRSIVIATSESSHTTGIGGSARTTSDVEIFGLGSQQEAVNRSAESAGGDGVATQIAGVGGPDAPVDVGSESSGQLVLHDIAP